MIKNKKAHVPTLLLALLTLILIILALVIFKSFSNSLNSRSELYSELIEKVEFQEQYITAKAEFFISKTKQKSEIQRLAGEKQYIYPGTEQFFIRLENGEFEFYLDSTTNKYVFSIQNILLTSKEDDFNKIERNFTLNLEIPIPPQQNPLGPILQPF